MGNNSHIDSVTEAAGAGPDLRRARRVRLESTRIDRLPPHSIEAEQGVLGGVFLDPNMVMPLCVEKLKAGGDEFYDLRHQEIYRMFLELYDNRDPIDVITVQERLKLWQKLELVGGIVYLSQLPDCIPTAWNAESYLEIICDKYTLRKMVHACTDVVGRIYDYEGEVDTLMDTVERDILRISESRVSTAATTIQEYVRQAINQIDDSYTRGRETVSGLTTGFTDYDRMTDGMKPGEMIVIAARPSLGKSSLAGNIAEHVAIELGLPVGFFSLEMSGAALVKRMLCSRSRVNLRNVRDGFLAERDMPRLVAASGRIATAPIYLDDTGGLSVLQVRARARRLHQQYGIRLFVVDYLQLMNAMGGKRRFESRQQEVSDISNGMKLLAKELNVPVIVISQLNREIEREKGRRPRLSDLRESGAVEQDADTVGFLYRPKRDEEENSEPDNDDCVPINWYLAKQREGPCGDINLTFLKQFTRFESAARVSDEDVPAEHTTQQRFPDP